MANTLLKLNSKKIILRSLKRDDIDKRLRWKKYRDPLYAHYNLDEMTRAQKRQWYVKRITNPKMIYFAIDNLKGDLLGFLNLYAIKRDKKRAKLGIYLRPEYVNRHYGSEAIATLLPYYFEIMRFKELRLDVASHNLRAIKCYQKCGFEFVRTFYNKHDPRNILDIFGNAHFKSIRKYFKKQRNTIMVQFKEIRITRRMWLKLSGSSM